MNFFSHIDFNLKESNIDFSEIEEALILVKERRANRNRNDEFLNVVDAEKIKSNIKWKIW